MLQTAEVGFNILVNILWLNMPSWHGQVQLYIGYC